MKAARPIKELAPWIFAAGICALAIEARAQIETDTLIAQVEREPPIKCEFYISGILRTGAELFARDGIGLTAINHPSDYCGQNAISLPVSLTEDPIVQQINDLYLTILHRAPDEQGRDWWVDQVKNHGKTVEDVRKNFEWCSAIPKGEKDHCE